MPGPEPTLLLYVTATLLICLSPGPNVLLMVSLGLRDGRAAVLVGLAGIVVASLCFLIVSALGVAAVLHASTTLFAVVRYVGAAYLVWIGVRLLAGARRGGSAVRGPGESRDDRSPAHTVPTPTRSPVRAAGGRAFWQGFVTHLSNPKAILFWTAVLPQFLDPARPVAGQIAMLGALGIAIDGAVLAGYGLAAAAARHLAPTHGWTRAIDAVAGAFFVATGALLALAHRH